MRFAVVDETGRAVDGGRRLDTRGAAAVLGVSAQTLANWRCQGRGPKALIGVDGWSPEYRVDDLAAWLNARPWTRPTARKAA